MYINQNSPTLKRGMIRYTSFWASKEHVDLYQMQRFEIVKKSVKIPTKWEKDLLTKNINTPWENAGVLIWQNYKPMVIWE